ncbi:MAG: hypothetical protein MJA83_15490 [Gammaproteobacteria bacterium]|nr:hypothetical protein [Gammaproteobacteria bacterium]
MSRANSTRLPAGIRNAKSDTTSRRKEVSHSFVIEGPVDQVFGLLDPVSERDWVDDWDPAPVFPEELSRDAGTVFTLERDGRTAVWTVLRHEPTQHVAEYLIAEPEYQHRWIYVSCSGETENTTRVSVRYVVTALSDAGQEDMSRYGAEFLRAWEEPMRVAINKLAS